MRLWVVHSLDGGRVGALVLCNTTEVLNSDEF